jgi:hypothetical protein
MVHSSVARPSGPPVCHQIGTSGQESRSEAAAGLQRDHLLASTRLTISGPFESSFSCGWQCRHPEPKFLDGIHNLCEVQKVDGLCNIAVCVKPVGSENIVFGRGAGQDHDRNGFELHIGLDFGQHLATVFPRKIEIQQDEVWAGDFGIRTLPAHVGQRLNPIFHDMQAARERSLQERFSHHQDIGDAVFDQQNINRSAHDSPETVNAIFDPES